MSIFVNSRISFVLALMKCRFAHLESKTKLIMTASVNRYISPFFCNFDGTSHFVGPTSKLLHPNAAHTPTVARNYFL